MSRESVLNPPVSTCLVRVVTTRQGRRHGCRPHWDDDLKSLKSTPKDSYSVFYNQEKVRRFGKKTEKTIRVKHSQNGMSRFQNLLLRNASPLLSFCHSSPTFYPSSILYRSYTDPLFLV